MRARSMLEIVAVTVKQERRQHMALFFDRAWFEEKLAERGLTRGVLAAAAGLSPADIDLAFKDQRELSAAEVAAFAELLGEDPAEVASRAGVTTPVPGRHSAVEARLTALERRVAALESELRSIRRR